MIYFALFFFSFILTYLVRQYGIKQSLFDIPNQRSSHTIPIPHGGGIAIAITWFLGLSYFFFTDQINPSLYYALMSGMLISSISYLDDLYELSAKVRLSIQTLVACMGLFFLGGLHEVDLIFFSIENQWFTNIFAFFMIVWFINLYNFLDGIDGYAGSEAVFLGIAGFILFGGEHFLVLISAVMGFLIWNWHKAKIFMGDVGSTMLGYNVAIFTLYYANQAPINLWTWIILFGLFWFDATLTLLRRYKNKEKLSQAHKKHAYQRLNQSGWMHDKVVIYSILINLLLLGLVYFMANKLLALAIAMILLYGMIRFVDTKKGFL